MSGYYPPGVTGNEPEIAGAEEMTFTPVTPCEECGYDGKVDAQVSGGVLVWYCPGPGCDTEREEDDPYDEWGYQDRVEYYDYDD